MLVLQCFLALTPQIRGVRSLPPKFGGHGFQGKGRFWQMYYGLDIFENPFLGHTTHRVPKPPQQQKEIPKTLKSSLLTPVNVISPKAQSKRYLPKSER